MAKLKTRRISSRGSSGYHPIPSKKIVSFKYGQYTFPEPYQIPRGAVANGLNFLSKGTKIEVRNGYTVLGNRLSVIGKSYGVFTGHNWNGTDILFKVGNSGKSLYYLNTTNNTWTEVLDRSGSANVLGATGGEDISFSEYFSPAGAQLWVSSPNTDLLKILTANPGTSLSQYTTAKNFKGRMQIKSNRMFLWHYKSNTNNQGSNSALQMSYIDKQAYTTVTAESVGTGDGSTKTFTRTLTQATGKQTTFAISVTDSNETFTDNFDGTLTGSLGGTGTINYITGALSVTFNTAPVNLRAITTTYQWEDSTNTGIADFTHSATRTAGQGGSFLQGEGGDFQNLFSFNSSEYCLHERKAYVLTISTDDTQATNLIYRERLAIPNWKAGVATAEGIYYIDTTYKSRPFVAVMTLNEITSLVTPKDLSSNILDLTNYVFDMAYGVEWDKYVIIACRTYDSTKNNRMILYNKDLGSFDIVDFYATALAVYNGTLVGGDSLTEDVYTLFSGFDDDGNIPNYTVDFNVDDLDVDNLKKLKRLWFEGQIDTNQSVNVYAAIDRGTFVLVGTITGTGTYVDRNQSVAIGSLIVGLYPIGAQVQENVIFSNHYLMQIKLKLDKFKYLQIRLVPQGIGYFSVSMLDYFDIRVKADKLPQKYR